MMWENSIDTILSEYDLPFYYGMPEFCEGGEPGTYMVYTDTARPAQRADGEITTYSNRVTLDVFSTSIATADSLAERVVNDFEARDIRLVDVISGVDSGSPQYQRRTLEFYTLTEKET